MGRSRSADVGRVNPTGAGLGPRWWVSPTRRHRRHSIDGCGRVCCGGVGRPAPNRVSASAARPNPRSGRA